MHVSALQERWFSGSDCVTMEQLKVLKALPIYEAAAAPGTEKPAGAFLDLLEDRFLAPDGTDEALLAPSFLKPAPAGEARVLVERLGVKMLTQQELIREHVLPRYSSSYSLRSILRAGDWFVRVFEQHVVLQAARNCTRGTGRCNAAPA